MTATHSRTTPVTPSFSTLKYLSFLHSTVYAVLLIAWIVPGLHPVELVFGLAHGLGWILMCVLCIEALRAQGADTRAGR